MADPAFGAKSTVLIDFEQTWGVAKGVAAGKQIGVVSNTITPSQELIDNPTLRGDYNSVDPFNGRKAAAGDLVIVPTIHALPIFTKWLTGTLVESGTTPDYVLTSTLGTTTPGSCVIETSYDIASTMRYSRVTGARLSRVSIPFQVDGPLQMTLGVMGKDVTTETTAYDGSPTDMTGGAVMENLLLLAADLKIGGGAVGYIQSGQIDIDTGLFGDDYRVGGLGSRGSLVPGRYRISGNLRLVLDSTSVLTLLSAGTASSIALKYTSAADNYFSIDLPRVFFQKTGPTLANEGPVVIDAQFRAVYDSGDSTSITLVTANGDDLAATDYA